MRTTGDSLLELRKFVAPEFVFGVGARHLAARYANNYGVRKALIVTDQTLRDNTPWVTELLSSFCTDGISCCVFDQISQNPRAQEVMRGAEVYRLQNCDVIVAIGGGSVMDCAKGIGIICSNGGHILQYEGVDKILSPMPPLICIPTTSGTGSEVSQFTIILDEERRTKVAIVSKAVVPDVGLVDPETTLTQDAWLTACTGMDALSHAVEAYVSNASSSITDLHALEAISLIWNNLPHAVDNLNDLECRANLLLGSLQAGLAFSNAILGAVHALAHSLGGCCDLPHGLCNAILLGPVSAKNYPACPERYRTIGRLMGITPALCDASMAQAFAQTVNEFRHRLGIRGGLGGYGVARSALPKLAEQAARDACLATNPCLLTKADLEALYEQAY